MRTSKNPLLGNSNHHHPVYAISAIAAGLSISGASLRFTRRDLRGGFFARYGLMVMAISLGGVALSLLLTTDTILLDNNVMVPTRPSEILYMAVFAVVAGGVLGATEGVVIAFPLAGLLGLFGDGD
jgi:hypothetical protein